MLALRYPNHSLTPTPTPNPSGLLKTLNLEQPLNPTSRWVDNYIPLAIAIGSYKNTVAQVVFGFYWWSWFVLMRIMLFNIMTAIIVTAFAKVAEGNKKNESFLSEASSQPSTATINPKP